MSKENKVTVWMSTETKGKLDSVKVIPEEPYDKVVQRLLAFFKEHTDRDRKEGSE